MPTFPASVDLSDLTGVGFSFSTVPLNFNGKFSAEVSSAGDVNGDGFADILIGAGYDGIYGASYVVFGNASGFDGTVDLSTVSGTTGFRMFGGGFGHGLSVASAGDMNGDGFADVAVTTVPTFGQNATYVVFGKATGFVDNLDVTTLSAKDGFKVVGANSSSYDGEVASAGDVNGDGFDDLFLKSEGAAKNYVLFGAATGLGTSINVATLDGTNGFSITSVASQSFNHIGSAGDFNGDGFADLIFSNDGDSGDSALGWGDAYVIFGKASGFAANINTSTLDGGNGFRMEGFGGASDSFATGSSVSSAGDVNGDGFDDMIVGAKSGLALGDSSKAYIVFGKASGFSSSLLLSDLDGTNGFALVGSGRFALTGYSVAAAGDVNGDGFADLIVGAPGENASYVVYGKASGFAASIWATDLDGTDGFKLSGDPAGGGGSSVASAGDINGDGAPDLIIASLSGTTHVVYGIPAEDTTVTDVGSSRLDVMYGGMLDDNLIGLAGNDRLYGLAGDDVLSGGNGNDVLAGGAGDDNMAGGAGIDTAYFAAAQSGVAANLATGRASGTSTGTDAMSGIENLTGSSFNDVLTGNAAVNVLTSGVGNDKLDGGLGADVMIGDIGNDTYYVDNLGDAVTEAVGGGIDTVRTTLSTYTLGSDVERLAYIGSGNFVGIGNALANVLTGGAGTDTLSGLAGDDVLDGGTGADGMTGGADNDTYYVDDAGDAVTEIAGGGMDTVRATWSTYTLTSEVERLEFAGSGNFVGAGNELANRLTGGAGNDTLSGHDGDDVLNGGTGADGMTGGADNDTYYVDDAGDAVTEIAGGGIDTVLTTLSSYMLTSEVDRLTFTGAGNFVGTGNEIANRVTGGAGDDTLDGGAGNDKLTGGGGSDTFVFSTALHARTNLDAIVDFNVAGDSIGLSQGIFAALGAGPLSEDEFFIGAAAHDADDRIIYNDVTGRLSYDADGSGAGAATQFAALAPGLALTHDHLFII